MRFKLLRNGYISIEMIDVIDRIDSLPPVSRFVFKSVLENIKSGNAKSENELFLEISESLKTSKDLDETSLLYLLINPLQVEDVIEITQKISENESI